MTIDAGVLFAIASSYLLALFLLAFIADRGWLPKRLWQHPLVYTLSLGVYATSWSYYGSVGFADRAGFAFLTIYIGVTFAFLLGRVLLQPILRLSREHQLTSIADLMAWRYGGRASGLLVTVFLLLGTLPYLALQIRAFSESIRLLSAGDANSPLAAIGFCALVMLFTALFGSGHLSQREQHRGLVVAIAFESALKLMILLLLAMVVLTQVYDSPIAFNAALSRSDVEALYEPIQGSLWPTLLLLSFCASFLLPRQYHMTFAENSSPKQLEHARYLFPLYLLLLNLPIIPILFAGRHLELGIAPDYYVLGIAQALDSPALAILVFLGGVSAASAMMIVTTLALAYMSLNHLVLPAALTGGQTTNFYRRLIRVKRIIIMVVIAAGYGFYRIMETNEGLASQGLISFVAVAQLLPGVIGLLYWPRATRVGLVSGLSLGALAWFILLILPLIPGAPDARVLLLETTNPWALASFCSLSLNGIGFIIGSLLSRPTVDELAAAERAVHQSSTWFLDQYTALSVTNYRYLLQEVLGNEVARAELERALQTTGISPDETRRSELRLLHEELERSLSGLVGPTLARQILRQNRRPEPAGPRVSERDASLLEQRLEQSREQMQGLALQLDNLRRYQREVLQSVPIGVCSIAPNGTILLWNSAMAELSGISERSARARRPEELLAPWGSVMADFVASGESRRINVPLEQDGQTLIVNLLSASVREPQHDGEILQGRVILIEDRSELDSLTRELTHSERLASIGALAAGVAHEIGNPLTGIASIAQNLEYELGSLNSAQQQALAELSQDILSQTERINVIVRSLLTFSHADSIVGRSVEMVSINEVVQEARRLISLGGAARDYRFEIDIDQDLIIDGDRTQLTQVFVNLIKNAVDASPSGSIIRIEGHVGNEGFEIAVVDEGTGIRAADAEKVFDPFYTTKAVGQGTGLGLAMVYSIVNSHGGRVRFDLQQQKGARVVVELPKPKQVGT